VREREGQRLLIGFDGSEGAQKAIHTLLDRRWGIGSEVCLVAALDSAMNTAPLAIFNPFLEKPSEEEVLLQDRMTSALEEATERLERAGLKTTSLLTEGSPGKALLQEAEQWEADAILVGARGLRRRESGTLGRVARSIAERAHCSVEIIRAS
jgi:nucleotide-binding universal stress UspA family protein